VLDLKTWVNGALMQNGHTSNFIFDVRYLVSYLSGIMTLRPGDVIATGTPAGVGFSRKPPITLQPGDTVRLQIMAWRWRTRQGRVATEAMARERVSPACGPS
jgi:2-keto-4-pentenoate hydratase/2-oxohepta-3-ene-1,7-dioic acid hydratase in catechol pathway